MIRKLALFAISSGLAAAALKRWLDRTPATAPRPPERAEVQRWEDEGGSLPPSPAAAASDDYAGVRMGSTAPPA